VSAAAGAATWRQRVRGCLLLSACGDALGAPFEGAAVVTPAAVDMWFETRYGVLRWTDDTALTLVLAEHVARTGGTVEQAALAGELARAWARHPVRGYGRGAATVLASIHRGAPWAHAAAGLFGGQGSFGNGAAMRVAPLGLVPGLGLSAVAARARRSAAITHAHPQAQDGAAVQAVAVALASRSTPGRPLDPAEFAAGVAAHAYTRQFRQVLQRIAPLLGKDPDPARVAAEIGNDVTAIGSVPAAVAAFLRTPDSPTAAVRFAINLGGDADTIAAMTGALCGARLGERHVPAPWVRRLEHAELIDGIAGSLADLLTGQRPGVDPDRPGCRPVDRRGTGDAGHLPAQPAAGYPDRTTPEPGQAQT
jgi:poly(ADP-ribose) glycohydrolase ARH3